MNYALFVISLLPLFLANGPSLEKKYYCYYNPGGAHTFTTQLLIKHSSYSQTQYATSATSAHRESGSYTVKTDTLILWKDKIVIYPRRKGERRKVITCPQDTNYDCRPEYYLIRQDSLIALYYTKGTPRFKRASFVFVASH